MFGCFGGIMEVRKEHVVDCGERDDAGLYDYYYAHWLFSFRDGDLTLVARSYDNEAQKAHFLRREVAGARGSLTAPDLASPLFAAACDYLCRVEGKTAIAVLKSGGYEDVNPPGRA
jgi:hypothetical protein